MARSLTWVNKDGLTVRGGRHTIDNDIPARVVTAGKVQTLVINVPDLTALDDDATTIAAGYFVNAPKLPANAFIHEVRIITRTAATSGGAADLLIGVYTLNATTKVLVAVDADGLCAAGDSALSDFSVAGETIVLGKAAGAAIIGKTVTHTAETVVIPTYATAAYTAGALEIQIDYSV